MLYQLSYASLHGSPHLRHTYACFYLPAGTNYQLSTTANRVQAANQLRLNHFAKTADLELATPADR
jgi:hypothetical protein